MLTSAEEDKLIIEEARRTFEEGVLAFKPPQEMELYQTQTFEAAIARGQPLAAVFQGLAGQGEPKIEPLKVHYKMKVVLKSDDNSFEIKPITADIRRIDLEEKYTAWKWAVTAKESGEKEIHLIAGVVIDRGKGDETLFDKTFDHKIKVKVSTASTWKWATRNWHVLLTVLVLPFLGWLGKLVFNRWNNQKK